MDREALVRRALLLEQFSIAWMLVEGGVAVATGLAAHSVALLGFGFDSALELVSAVALFHRLRSELRGGDVEEAERVERRALRVVGVTLLALCVYIVVDAGLSLLHRRAAEGSGLGLAVTLAALVAMPLLGMAKLRVGKQLQSRALMADAKETFACAWLSAATALGVGATWLAGWWWADSLAALALVPLVFREGREALEEAAEEG